MGVVYRALDVRLDRPAAVKVLTPAFAQDEQFRARFLREWRLAAALDHPHVLPVYEAGEAGGVLYLATRFVDGRDLGRLIADEGPLPPDRALATLEGIAGALDVAHGRGLVHRDVKPGNVLLDLHGHAYLADFGLSTMGGGSLTGSGHFAGTADYVAPERVEGRQASAASDQYALACVLVECLTGLPPFPRDSPLAVLWAHVQDDPPRLSDAGLPAALDAVVERGLAKDPAERFDSCLELLEAARGALAGRAPAPRTAEARKVVTVLCASVDLAGSAGGGLDPEVLSALGERCREQIGEVVLRHGGRPEATAGGVMALFGVPVAREDDTLRAARAALELREACLAAVAGAGIEVTLRAGVEAGEVVTAGDASAGQPLQEAAALLRMAGAGEILLGRDAYAVLRAHARVKRDGDAVRLAGLVEGRTSRTDSPFVGRGDELATLERLFGEAVATRSCRTAAVVGPAGIGKTRLVQELTGALGDAAAPLWGRCLSYGEGITFWPLRDLVLAAAGGDSLANIRAVLEGEPDGELVASRVAGTIGVAEVSGGREETAWAIRRLFETLARRRPLVLAVDDAHWADPGLLDVLEQVAADTRDAPILLVYLARPELVETRPELTPTAIPLEPLPGPDAARLVEARTGPALPPQVVAGIINTAEGNPFFLEQLLAVATEPAPGGHRPSLPPAVHAVLAARLDALQPDERLVLECAAVEGVVFHVGPLAELAPSLGPVALGRALIGLTRKQLVQPARATFAGEEALRFSHGLIREAAYESLTRRRRAELHEAFANALERLVGERAGEEAEFVGYHLEQAVQHRRLLGDPATGLVDTARRAAQALAGAGRTALARGDFRAAVTLLERAVALVADDDRAPIEIDLAVALLEAGRLAEADAVAAAAENRPSTSQALCARAAVERLTVGYSLDLSAAVAELAERGDALERVLADAEDERGLYRLWLLRGMAKWATGELGAAERAWEQAAVFARAGGDRVSETDPLGWLASAAFWGPATVAEAIPRLEASLRELRDRPFRAADVLHCLAGLHAMAGRFDIADAQFREAHRLRAELGASIQWPISQIEALAAAMAGDTKRAAELLELGVRLLDEMGERSFLATMTALLARPVFELGRADEALALTERAQCGATDDDVVPQATWRGVRARILARRGDAATAEALAREAVALAGATDYVTVAAEAYEDLADVLEASGRGGEAAAALRAALERYERKGHEVAARRVGALLAAAPST